VPCRSTARAVTGAISSRTFVAGNHNVLANDHKTLTSNRLVLLHCGPPERRAGLALNPASSVRKKVRCRVCILDRLPVGIALGTFLAFLIVLLFVGVSERMTKKNGNRVTLETMTTLFAQT
jgi:hypothetical protein